MCILCTARKWCRRGAAMLPWLVIPLVCLWGLSGLLLPARFRIEVTSPRLACVLVLLATLFWYEVVVPRLSVWRARHSARVRERRLSQAIELQKLRKTATRRCRNCSTPYRDQNPGGGGRFMCANCGHVSKRPILDLPTGGNELSGRNGWICNQDWLAFGCGNWVNRCLTENVVLSACKLLMSIFSYIWWVWRRTIIFGSSREDDSSDKDSKGFSSNEGDNGENSLESRVEKARRKAEEKRQSRLEKEMLEEEERKQREEVARLVEERRKLRDEVLEAEKESSRRSSSAGKKENQKGAEKRRLESSKEKDKGSSKSNSDCEELEKRGSRDREEKRAFDNKSEKEKRALQRTAALDRTKGPFQYSSRGSGMATSFIKANRPANGFDHRQISGYRKDVQSTGHATGKITSNVEDRRDATNHHLPVESVVQPLPPAQKKSWLQLFTRSPAVSPCPDAIATVLPKNNSQLQAQSVHITDLRVLPNNSLDNHISSRQSLPFTGYPMMNCSVGSNPVKLAAEYMPPFFIGSRRDLILDDEDVFEDPCNVSDPVRLIGPFSKSLNNFPLDLGPGFVVNDKMEPPLMKKVSAPVDVNKPSPIGSPLSGLRVSGERHSLPGQVSNCTHGSNLDETSNTHEPATWQMWGSPVAQDGLGILGRANWFSHLGQNNYSQEDVLHSLLHEPLVSLSHVAKESNFLPGTHTPQSVCMANYHNGGICTPFNQLPDDNVLWAQRTGFHPLTADGDHHSFRLTQMDNVAVSEVEYDAPNDSASSQNSESSSVDCWSKTCCISHGHGLQDVGNSPFAGPRLVGPFAPKQGVQPDVWYFN